MKEIVSSWRRRLGRWFPGTWAVLAFALPLVAFAAYAAATSTRLYYLEIKLAADRPTDLLVSFDPGAGYSADTEMTVHASVVSDSLRTVNCPIPVDRFRAVRISPVGEPGGRIDVGSLAVRTRFKIWARPRTYRTYDAAALRSEPREERLLPRGVRAWRLEAAGEGVPAPFCELAPPAPLSVGFSWWYAGYRWAAFACGWLCIWMLINEAARRTVWWRAVRWPTVRWRVSPVRQVWLVAAVSVVLSCYPVIFLGKSFVSVNFEPGPHLLYDGPTTLPGTTNPQTDSGRGADIFAMSNQFSPYAMVQRRALFEDGELPLWNRYDEVGLALFGQGQSMFGDPLHLLVIAANGRAWAWDVKFVLAKWVFAAGVGLLVLAATDCLPAALLLCFSSAFIGFFAYRLNHGAYFSVCYAPWILYAWLRIVRAPTRLVAGRWAGGLLLANWMELHSGTAKEAYMLLAGLNGSGGLVLLLSRLPAGEKLRRLLWVAAAGGIFCLLASPSLLAFFDTLQKSGSSYEVPLALQIQPSLLIGFFDDIFYRQFNWGEGVLGPSLNGLVLLGILLAVGGSRRLLGDRTFAVLALATLPTLAIVFGVVPPEAIRQMPFLRNIYHIDNTFSCVLLIQCLVLAGFGLKHCLTYTGRFWRRDVLMGLAAGAVLLGAYFGAISVQQRSNVQFQPATKIVLSPFFCWYVPTVTLAILALPFVLRRLRRHGPRFLSVAALACCLVLLHWRMGVQTHTDFSPYTPVLAERVDLLARSPAVDRLLADRESPFRAFGTGYVFAPGYGAMVGIETTTGLDALWNPYVFAVDAVSMRVGSSSFMDVAPRQVTLGRKCYDDLLGIRYYLTMPNNPLPELPGVRLTETLDLNIYRNEHAWPRAFFVDRLGTYQNIDEFASQVMTGDGQPFAAVEQATLRSMSGLEGRFPEEQAGRKVAPATGYRLTNHRTAFDINAPAPGVVVLTEPYMDGDLVAELNGARVPVWRVNHAFRGIVVDRPGTYHVVFDYAPRGFAQELWASAGGLVLAAVAGWRLYRRPPSPGVTRPPVKLPSAPVSPLPPAGARP